MAMNMNLLLLEENKTLRTKNKVVKEKESKETYFFRRGSLYIFSW
jgi:hypothetical protein